MEAARRHGIEPAHWLDLSTGINPHAYPVAPLDPETWRRLPEEDDGLAGIAAHYYAAPAHATVLPIAGTQAAIQALPRVLPRVLARSRALPSVLARARAGTPLRIAVAALTYNEYAHAWRNAGHDVRLHAHAQLPAAAAQSDVMVLCQPNNPTGESLPIEAIRRILASFSGRDAWLIVDEAYMDATPEASLLHALKEADLQRVLVLRSVGKFFGLAGARAGFAIGGTALIEALREELGPWPLSGPTRAVVARALADTDWQARTRTRLDDMCARLNAVLLHRLGVRTQGTVLFRWFEHARAQALCEHLARHAILVRRFAAPAITGPAGLPSLRFGLPADAAQLDRLDTAVESFT